MTPSRMAAEPSGMYFRILDIYDALSDVTLRPVAPRSRRRWGPCPQIKPLAGLAFPHLPTVSRDGSAHVATTTFVARRENVVLLGPPGTGTTHCETRIR